MEFKQLLADDDAVSPVIGVILMVAITVILAAVIGTFVLGLGDQVQQTSPNAQFTFDYESGATDTDDWSNDESTFDGSLTITHDGGSTVTADRLSAVGASSTDPAEFDSGPFSEGSDVTAGSSADLAVNSGDSVRIVWTSESGDQTATLAEWEGPDA